MDFISGFIRFFESAATPMVHLELIYQLLITILVRLLCIVPPESPQGVEIVTVLRIVERWLLDAATHRILAANMNQQVQAEVARQMDRQRRARLMRERQNTARAERVVKEAEDRSRLVLAAKTRVEAAKEAEMSSAVKSPDQDAHQSLARFERKRKANAPMDRMMTIAKKQMRVREETLKKEKDATKAPRSTHRLKVIPAGPQSRGEIIVCEPYPAYTNTVVPLEYIKKPVLQSLENTTGSRNKVRIKKVEVIKRKKIILINPQAVPVRKPTRPNKIYNSKKLN